MTALCWESATRMAHLKPEASYWAKLQWMPQACDPLLPSFDKNQVEILSVEDIYHAAVLWLFLFFQYVISVTLTSSSVVLGEADHFLLLSQLEENGLVFSKTDGSVTVTTVVLQLCDSYFGRFYLLFFSPLITTINQQSVNLSLWFTELWSCRMVVLLRPNNLSSGTFHIKLKCFFSVAASKVKCAILGDFEEKLETWEKLETPFHLPLPELDSELLWPESKNLVTSSFLVVVVRLFEDTSVRSKSETCC